MSNWRDLIGDQWCGWGERPSCVTVTLQGITLEGSVRSDSHYGLVEWDGWTNAGDRRGGPVSNDTGDDRHMGRVDMVGRRIRLEGVIRSDRRRELAEMREKMGAILTRPRADWMVVNERLLGLKRQALVTLPRPVQLTDQPSRRRVVYTLELSASDWRRVAVDQSKLTLSPGESGSVVNAGKVEADMVAELKGPLGAGVQIVGPAGTWTYNNSVASGQTIGVDFATRLVRDYANGLQLRPAVRGSWHEAAPGSATYRVVGSGTGTVELRWRSSWA